jgi:hypothetical protein
MVCPGDFDFEVCGGVWQATRFAPACCGVSEPMLGALVESGCGLDAFTKICGE